MEIGDSFSSTATFMAIVVCYDTTLTTQNIIIDYVSLMAGDIPTRPAPQTADEVLRKCQYYYEMSYDSGTTTNPAGSTSNLGQLVASCRVNPITGSSVLTGYAPTFGFAYNSLKRIAPTITIYSPATGSSGKLQAILLNNDLKNL